MLSKVGAKLGTTKVQLGADRAGGAHSAKTKAASFLRKSKIPCKNDQNGALLRFTPSAPYFCKVLQQHSDKLQISVHLVPAGLVCGLSSSRL